jgi:hypothetical protein
MYDCSDDVLGYHNDEVTLPEAERKAMRERRNSNRQRLDAGLIRNEKPSVLENKAQGSYAMRTMLRHPTNDYDIDDGVYFWKEDLVGPRGAEMTPRQTKEMVRDAVDHGLFTTPPDIRTNCVRIYYAKGYHVDMPVYRRVTTTDWAGNVTYHNELASGSTWKRSDACDVTEWFNDERRRSGDATQIRRIVRLIKKFAKSRDSWGSQILSGFGITKLVTEEFRRDPNRLDTALYDTMLAIRDRLLVSERVEHPTTPDTTITSHPDSYHKDAKAAFLCTKLTEALVKLEPIFVQSCTRKEALQCWDAVFSTTYFVDGYEEEAKPAAAAVAAPAVLSSGLLVQQGNSAMAAVRKEGGGRHA